MGCCRRVIRHVAMQRSEEQRARFMADISAYDPASIIWIDESGCDRRNSMRKFAYTLRGIPPVDHRILARGTRYSAITAISVRGVQDVVLAEGSVNGEAFAKFVEDSLVPILQPFNCSNPNSIVVMDNASIHHVDEVAELIIQTGALLYFLPPYSPDLNPVEQVFSKVKAIMKENDQLFQVYSVSQECFLQWHLIWSLTMTVRSMQNVVDTMSCKILAASHDQTLIIHVMMILSV